MADLDIALTQQEKNKKTANAREILYGIHKTYQFNIIFTTIVSYKNYMLLYFSTILFQLHADLFFTFIVTVFVSPPVVRQFFALSPLYSHEAWTAPYFF